MKFYHFILHCFIRLLDIIFFLPYFVHIFIYFRFENGKTIKYYYRRKHCHEFSSIVFQTILGNTSRAGVNLRFVAGNRCTVQREQYQQRFFPRNDFKWCVNSRLKMYTKYCGLNDNQIRLKFYIRIPSTTRIRRKGTL